MHSIFNITRYNRFLSLHIVKQILIVKSREKLVTIVAVKFKLTALFKSAEIYKSRVRIQIDLAMSLISSTDSASDFDCLSLTVAFLCETSIFFGIFIMDNIGFF